jgi:hypothetical protein
MKYQLVLQFPAKSREDFDRFVAIEDSLIEELGDLATVDGHDFGMGKFNIFVFTDEPNAAFGKARRIAESQGVAKVMRSAYRELEGEVYVILWPPSGTEFSVL